MQTVAVTLPSTAGAGRCYWFTGLSGAGKTALAHGFRDALHGRGNTVVVLDGDVLRQGLNRDLGFSREDRRENVRRIAEMASVLVNAGLVVLVAVIAPYREDRAAAHALFNGRPYFEVYVATDQATCAARDPKGLYHRAHTGLLYGMTGVHAPYEAPAAPALRLDTSRCDIADCIASLAAFDQTWLSSSA